MATRNNQKSNRLAEIISAKRRQGSGVTAALAGGIKERLKEKFDPRQLINQKGLLTSLFPGLKAYSAKTGAAEKISKSSLQLGSFDEIKPILETISFNTKLTAKNTMVLPALHRDVNVIRQNMVKLVKLKGVDARTKADMFFTKSKEREDKYERELRKERAKSGGINKLLEKDDDNKDEEKGFLSIIVSVIKKALKGIVKSILALGRAIVSVFKLLGGLIVDAISGVANLLLNTVLGIAGFLKDGIGLIFDSLIAKSIINFFKKSNFIFLILRSIGVSVIGWLFSKLGLRRLVMGMIPYLWPILALEFGLQGAGIFFRAKSTENPLTSPDFIDRMKAEEQETGQVFPTSDGKKGVPLSKSRSWFTRSEEELSSGGALNQETNSFIKSKSVVAPEPYKLIIPGLSNSRVLYLDNKEAMEWGNKRKEYVEILDEYRDIFERKMEGKKQRVGNENAGERLIELQKDHDEIQAEMLDYVERIAKKTMDPKSDYFKNLMQEVGKAKKGIYNVDFLEQAKQELWDGSYAQGEADRIIGEMLNPLEEEAKKFPTQLRNKMFNAAEKASIETKAILTDVAEKARTKSSEISDNLQETNILKSKVSEPIVIFSTDTEQKRRSPPFVQPASAWNDDFIKYDYLGSSFKKWWRIEE